MISARDMGCLIFGEKLGLMTMLAVYADDSADGNRQTLFTVDGFMGYPQMFIEAETKWKAYLASKGLAYFKAREAEHSRGEFAPTKLQMSPQAARTFGEYVIFELGKILVEEHLGDIALSLDMQAFNKVLSEQADAISYFGTKDCYVFMFKQFIIHCVGLMKRDMPEYVLPIAFVFDDHTRWREAEESCNSSGRFFHFPPSGLNISRER